MNEGLPNLQSAPSRVRQMAPGSSIETSWSTCVLEFRKDVTIVVSSTELLDLHRITDGAFVAVHPS